MDLNKNQILKAIVIERWPLGQLEIMAYGC